MHLSNIDDEAAEEINLAVIEHLRALGIKHRFKKHVLPVIKHSQQQSKHGAVFRRPLQGIESVDALLVSGEKVKVPSFVVDACSSIRQSLGTEGIFRKGGSAARQKEMKMHIDEGKKLGMNFHEVDVANLLKLFLRELPEPLLPNYIHDLFMRCLLLREKKVEGLLLVCLLLPASNLNTLTYLMEFFSEVVSQSNVNRMDKNNIAIVITPTIMPVGQDKMTATSSIRLTHHIEVIELLIQYADKIGVLPDHFHSIVNPSNLGSFSKSKRELLCKSDSDILQNSKKKKSRRSGSLTRMFHGFKKMVGNKPEADQDLAAEENNASECALEPKTPAPSIKPGSKRKALIATSAFSMKKKREILKALPQMQTLVSTPAASSWPTEHPDLHTLTPCVCQHPKSLERRQIDQSLMQVLTNRDKSQSVLTLVTFSCHEQGSDSRTIRNKNPRTATSPPPTGSKSKRFFTSKPDKGDREQEVEKRSRLSLRGRKGAKKQEKKDDLHCSEMSTASNQSAGLQLESRWSSSIFGRKKRIVDVQLLEPAMEMMDLKIVSDENPGTSETSCHASSQSDSYMSLDGINLSQQNNMSNDSDDFVRVPKKEFEAIKNRVSAIEDKMSEAFENISMSASTSSNNDGVMQAKKVQTAYEKTLEESTTFDNTSSSTDNLAKRLGRDLKIRQSLENKVIRSPSARRIGTLRRRSRESARSFRNNSPGLRNTPLVRNISERISRTPEAHFYPRSALKRGGPNTVWSGLHQPEPIDSSLSTTPKENARINLCFHNDHASGIAPRADDMKESIMSSSYSSPLTRSMLQQLSSQENNPSSATKIPVPIKYLQAVQASPRHFAAPNKQGTKEWQDAQGFFKANPTPPQISITGRASVSKILEQNAGMVSQRMKIFDSSLSGGEPATIQAHRRSFERTKPMEAPGPQFKRVMSALQMCQSTIHPTKVTSAPILSTNGKSENPKKIGSPRKLSKAKNVVQRKKSNFTKLLSPKVGPTNKSELKKYQKSDCISSNLAISSKGLRNPMSPGVSTLLQNSKENVPGTYGQAQSGQMPPFVKPRPAILFSPQSSLPDNLKETIYNVCTPDVEKVLKCETSMSPLKESNRASTKAKTPRETPYIKQPLMSITPHHFGKTPKKMTADRNARIMLTPMRAIMTDSCGTPLGLPRRQSPRLLLKAHALVKHPDL